MNKKSAASLAILAALTSQSCTSSSKQEGSNRETAQSQDRRGSPAEYDPGPPKDSDWADIFAETPDYRAYGKAIYEAAAKRAGIRDDGREKFRWKVGPMWYRGRLTPESVKVFVVGQEGAQDENVTNRTFTGSTGTKMQSVLNYIGIDRSYLFMNTFIYTITGQYGERAKPEDSAAEKKKKEVMSNALFWLAQSEDSAIVQHRHRMFNYMLDQNKRTLSLVIGVGSAGKDSVATWIRSKGGRCTARDLSRSFCDASVLRPGAIAIGVVHPGGASARNGGGGQGEVIRRDFDSKTKILARRVQEQRNWLIADPGMRPNFSRAYSYQDVAIPHRDFAFGTNWRMGKDGTASNRKGADGIQIYSDNGCYNNTIRESNGRCAFIPQDAADGEYRSKTLSLRYDEPRDIGPRAPMAVGDVPYESPKSRTGRRLYDVGPGGFGRTLMNPADGWPDFSRLGVTAHPSFGYGQLYRGNPENAKVLVLADQESQDDLFSTRAMTGTGGQQFQTFLEGIGASGNYLILRTLPVDTLDLSADQVRRIALNPDVTRARKAILDEVISAGKTQLILAVGSVAQAAITDYRPSLPVVAMDSPLERGHASQWNRALDEIASLGIAGLRRGRYDESLTTIPREDLPAHTRWWMGNSGTRASRAYTGGGRGPSRDWNGDYYKFDAPAWVNERNFPADPRRLSSAERASIRAFEQSNVNAFSGDGWEADED